MKLMKDVQDHHKKIKAQNSTEIALKKPLIKGMEKYTMILEGTMLQNVNSP